MALTNPHKIITDLAEAASAHARALPGLIAQASAVRYDRLPTSAERPEDGRRITGGHSDPTADIATDPARLELSHAVTRATRSLVLAEHSLGNAYDDLSGALEDWARKDTDD